MQAEVGFGFDPKVLNKREDKAMKESKTVKSCSNLMELDRISNLPSDLAEKILSLLPIRDAVRTSVLSTKWRYKSAILPHLVFDDAQYFSAQHQTFANVVDHVLSSHIGPLYKFKIVKKYIFFRDMDRWIHHMSRNSIKHRGECYKVPSSMFSCQDLTHLELHRCLLQLPSTFTGFKSLKTLKIVCVSLTDNALENMIVHCSLLERLTVEFCDYFSQLNINAPNLRFFHFIGDFDDINIVNTSNLVDAIIVLSLLPDRRSGPCRSTNLLKFFANLPHIQRLRISNSFTKYLAAGSSLEKLPNPCLHLKFFTLSICYNDPEDFLTALCLLKSSPALKELNIIALGRQHYQADAEKVNYWVDENQSCSFTQLRHVKICNFLAVEPAIDFVKFLLLSSPALETMTLYQDESAPSHDGSDLAKTLLRFRRASVKLEIILL